MGQRCKGKFIDTTFPVAKREPEKIQACMGFKPFTFSVKGGVLYQYYWGNSQLEAGHLAGVGITEVFGLNQILAWIFSGCFLQLQKLHLYNWDDLVVCKLLGECLSLFEGQFVHPGNARS